MKFSGSRSPRNWLIILFCGLITWSSTDAKTLKLTNGWKRLSEGAGPGPRSGSSVWTDKSGHAWLFGGRVPSSRDGRISPNVTRLASDLWCYDIETGRWSARVPEPTDGNTSRTDSVFSTPIGRELSAMCGITGGNLVIFGGRTSDNDVTDRMLIWHPKLLPIQFETRVCGLEADATAAGEAQSCPSARYDALSWCGDDHMTVVGGIDADGRQLVDAWKLDLQRLTWTRLITPTTGCSWTIPSNVTSKPDPHLLEMKNDTTNSTDEFLLEPLEDLDNPSTATAATAWSSPISGVHILCEHATSTSDANVQLWHQIQDVVWTLIGESGSRDSTTWPGIRLHADACSDSTAGNLWLFGGQSSIGGRAYVNNDVWTYDVSSSTWIKPEMPDASTEPGQRHRAAGWCHRDSMFVYGGSDEGDRILDDLWMLDINSTSSPKSSSSSSAVRHQVDDYVNLSTLRRRIPTLIDGSSSSDGATFGSAAIFFGISLSIFAIFGVVLFFRRCVSCPPRDSILLKEPPPVRYTVIPDEASYTI